MLKKYIIPIIISQKMILLGKFIGYPKILSFPRIKKISPWSI